MTGLLDLTSLTGPGGGGTRPDTPTISIGTLTPSGGTLTLSAFNDPDVGDTHVASRYQVALASDTGFESPLLDTGEDTVNLLSLVVNTLPPLTSFIARGAQRDSTGRWSRWSEADSDVTQGAALPPTSFSNLALWFSGGAENLSQDDGTTPVTEEFEVIGKWTDLSGNNRHATETNGSKKPTAVALNGRLCPWWDNSDDLLSLAASLSDGSLSTIFLVTNMDSFEGGTGGVWFAGNGSTYMAGFDSSKMYQTGITGFNHTKVALETFILEITRNGTSIDMWINGVSLGATQTKSNNNAIFSDKLGAVDTSGTATLSGIIADLVVFSNVKNSTERTQLRQYLATLNGVEL